MSRIRSRIRQAVASGQLEPRVHPRTRPAWLETEATLRSIALAAVAGAPAIAAAHGLSPVYQSPLPLAVYLALQDNFDAAVTLSLVMLAISLAVLVGLRDRWFPTR